MSPIKEVPDLADLGWLPVEVVELEEPGVVSVTSWANDGSVVTVTWDEIAGAVQVRWTEAGEERLMAERETVVKVSVREDHGRIEFWIWSEGDGLGGRMVVRVGDRVDVTDVILST